VLQQTGPGRLGLPLPALMRQLAEIRQLALISQRHLQAKTAKPESS
jgi:hypothetical protein